MKFYDSRKVSLWKKAQDKNGRGTTIAGKYHSDLVKRAPIESKLCRAKVEEDLKRAFANLERKT